ncbi:MAG TPA: protein kinase [Thermoanaerobaculia bacterium]|jgi:serine/threonine protein kinase/dipeptidyl aminopeptidase/acylaminoacyl peptidase
MRNAALLGNDMTLSAGSRLGPYELLAPLGAGGMGVVWRARDARLGRDVAIKALPVPLRSDPARLARFEDEARAASALNHPNIVTIYEIGETRDGPFLVMELVEGRTLRELLYAGALPARKALHLAAQLADALARAHEAGIVHRDLKPENVMVSREGFAKILDFGLAKFEHGDSGADESRRDLTLTEENRERAIVGTAGYMAPEQASGQAVGFRSDQFTFGALVYEMLSGRRAFHKETRAETLTAIIREEPEPLAALDPQIPIPLRWIVARCLAKAPEERYAATRDLARDLQNVRDHLSQVDGSGEGPRFADAVPKRPRLRLSGSVAVAVAALVAAAYFLGANVPARGSPSFQRLTFRDGTVWSGRFGPDARTVAYAASWGGGPIRVYTARPETPESSALPLPPASLLAMSGSGEIAVSLAARPSGAFATTGTLARSTLAGGAPREVMEGVQAADFGPDGVALAVLRSADGRSRLEFPIGHTLYETASGYLSHPRVSPRGDLVAFLEHPVRGSDAGSVAVVSSDGRKRVLSPGWTTLRGLAWSPDGGEVWFTAASVGGARALHAVSLSGRRRLVLRVPGALTLHDVSREGRVLLAHEHAREGIAGVSPGEAKERDLSWHDWSRPVDLTADGTAFLFDETGEGGGASYAVYLRATDESPAVRLGDGHALALSPDAKWALSTPQSEPAQLVLLPTGPGAPRGIATGGFDAVLRAAWLPGGERLVLSANEPGSAVRLYVQPAEGGTPRAITPENVGADWAVSPDGLRVAAIDGRGELRSYPVDDGGEPTPIPGAIAGDSPIRFSPEGRALYVLARGDGAACAIDRLDLATGRRTGWRSITPPDPVGVYGIPRLLLSADGASYVYAYVRLLDDLYLVDGLR